ncbi:MAG TPA: hypothetical protein VGJ59_08035 [Jatrophihabitantaceae bacterium]|jgi:hypothetical protein
MDRRLLPAYQPPPVSSIHRLGLHNIEIDQTAAAMHRCGTTHLPTGRVCMLPERHRGGCQFTERPRKSSS